MRQSHAGPRNGRPAASGNKLVAAALIAGNSGRGGTPSVACLACRIVLDGLALGFPLKTSMLLGRLPKQNRFFL
jgi:hypothetical protein